MRRTLLSLGLVCLCLSSVTPANAEIIDRVAAQVGSQIITLYDLRKAATPYLLQRQLNPEVLRDPKRRDVIYRQVLTDLVERKLIVQEASKLDMAISDPEVDQWMAYTRQQQGMSEADFKQLVGRYGLSFKEYRELVRENLLKVRMTRVKVGSKASVSDAEVERVYRERFGDPGAKDVYITVSHILIQPTSNAQGDIDTARKAAQAALTRIRGGEDFVTVAQQTSNGPSAKNGGRLGTFRRSELDPDFEKAAFMLDVNTASDVVTTKFGFHVILVSNRDERPDPTVVDRMDALRGELMQKSMDRQLKSYIQTLKSRTFVELKL